MITSYFLVFGELIEKQIEAENINNYMILTNEEAIKHCERR
jgi:hypothetical protein